LFSIHLSPKAVPFGIVAQQRNFSPKLACMELLNQPIGKSLRQTTFVTECTRLFRLTNLTSSGFSLFYELQINANTLASGYDLRPINNCLPIHHDDAAADS